MAGILASSCRIKAKESEEMGASMVGSGAGAGAVAGAGVGSGAGAGGGRGGCGGTDVDIDDDRTCAVVVVVAMVSCAATAISLPCVLARTVPFGDKLESLVAAGAPRFMMRVCTTWPNSYARSRRQAAS